jgi:hypothetical protein
MHYNALKSIAGSQKLPIPLQTPSESFYLRTENVEPYIEPTFTKEEYPTKKPTILLVSAVGASGKSTTAHKLAHDTGLPILDLAKHKTVAANALTGILTDAYPIDKVGAVLTGLRNGTHGIIIDGIDEGRSKTNEQGFEAFLDDIIKLSKGANSTSVIVFGRSQVLLNAWFYLADKGSDVALIRIDPFDLEQAKGYIDAYVQQKNSNQQPLYKEARDGVLKKLGAAFATSEGGSTAFLSFLGYPPVLDAIATLLQTEKNYHRIIQSLSEGAHGDLEVDLLIRIADMLLRREHDEKAVPNFIKDIANKADTKVAMQLEATLYDEIEQCARVLARALCREFPRRVIADAPLNEEYEKALASWCPEHPFLDDKRIRNAVFEAVAVSRCALSDVPEYQTLAFDFAAVNRPTYHLLYIMAQLAENIEIRGRYFNMLIQSCSDFTGRGHEIGIEVNGLSWDESDIPSQSSAELEVLVTIQSTQQQRAFKFKGMISDADVIPLGPFLANTTVTLPCDVTLKGTPALDCMGVCRIASRRIQIDAPDLIVRGSPSQPGCSEAGLFLDVLQAQGHVNTVTTKGGTIEIGCNEHNLAYPLAKYAQKTQRINADSAIVPKYRRLRRILLEFASHSKGGLAKYRDKIEHERVMRGDMGWSILRQLLKEDILYSDTKFYYVNADKLSKVLGTTWHELRQYKITNSAAAFLKRVP